MNLIEASFANLLHRIAMISAIVSAVCGLAYFAAGGVAFDSSRPSDPLMARTTSTAVTGLLQYAGIGCMGAGVLALLLWIATRTLSRDVTPIAVSHVGILSLALLPFVAMLVTMVRPLFAH